jgi:hypothetical protein
MSFETEYYFIRVGGLIATVALLTPEGGDLTPLLGLVETAAQRLEEVEGFGEGQDGDDLEERLLELVLLPEDIEQVDAVNDWIDDGLTDTDSPDRYGVCGADAFPDELEALGEVGREMLADSDNGPFALHSVVQLPDDAGVAAMEWIRAEMSCSSWMEDGDEFTVVESGELEVGDDTYWLIAGGVNAETGETAQVGFGFTRIGDIVSVVGMAQLGELNAELFGAVMALGAEKIGAGIAE